MIVFILSIAIFITSLFVDTNILGYTTDSEWYSRITYMFAHTNIIHLGINLYAYHVFNKLFSILNIQHSVIAFLSAYLATYGTEMQLPTVGLSGVIYAMWGMCYVKNHSKTMTQWVVLVLGCNILFVIFNVHINSMLHILSFVYSFVIYFIYGKIKHNLIGKI